MPKLFKITPPREATLVQKVADRMWAHFAQCYECKMIVVDGQIRLNLCRQAIQGLFGVVDFESKNIPP